MKQQTKPARRQPKTAKAVSKETLSPPVDEARCPFPVVGIGASAGGWRRF